MHFLSQDVKRRLRVMSCGYQCGFRSLLIAWTSTPTLVTWNYTFVPSLRDAFIVPCFRERQEKDQSKISCLFWNLKLGKLHWQKGLFKHSKTRVNNLKHTIKFSFGVKKNRDKYDLVHSILISQYRSTGLIN